MKETDTIRQEKNYINIESRETMERKEIIINILEELRPDVDTFEDVKLMEEGILDSFDIVSLMLEINEQFAIEIGVENVLPENFETLETIEALVDMGMKGLI